MKINEQLLERQIEAWLQEDIGFGDVTSLSTVSENLEGIGILYAKQSGVIAGLTVAERVFSFVDAELVFSPKVAEGAFVERGSSYRTGGRSCAECAGRRTSCA